MTLPGAAADTDPDMRAEPLDLLRLWALDGAPHLSTRTLPFDQLPADIARLLGQTQGMTRALEERHGTPLLLDVLAQTRMGQRLVRKVRLCGGQPPRPLALALIAMETERFQPHEVARLEAGEEPFGALVSAFGYKSVSRPFSYFAIDRPDQLSAIFGQPTEHGCLYGRFNTISNAGGAVLASVVEIISPTATGSECD